MNKTPLSQLAQASKLRFDEQRQRELAKLLEKKQAPITPPAIKNQTYIDP